MWQERHVFSCDNTADEAHRDHEARRSATGELPVVEHERAGDGAIVERDDGPADDAAARCRNPREGLGKKLVKLFKKELQTGDRAFDDAIYISTDTPETTAKLLADEQVRSTISLYVTTGGPIEIQGNTMRVTLMGRQEAEDPVVVALVSAVLGVAQP